METHGGSGGIRTHTSKETGVITPRFYSHSSSIFSLFLTASGNSARRHHKGTSIVQMFKC